MSDIISNTTLLSEALSTYYDKVLLERLVPQLRFYQFADKKPLPKHGGTTVKWTRFTDLGAGAALTEGTKPDSIQLSASNVSATIEQLGKLVRTTDVLEETAICDVVKESVTLLADSAAKTLDDLIQTRTCKLYTAAGNSCQVGMATGFDYFANMAGTWKLRIGGSAAANRIQISAMQKQALAVSSIRKVVTELRKRNVLPFSDGYYVGITHPAVADKLMADAKWATWNQYTNPQAMYKGEIGKVQGVRFVESANIDHHVSAVGSGSSLGDIYPTLIFGQHAYGTVETGLGTIKTYTVPSTKGDKADPLQQWSYIGYKITTAARILNESCGIIALTSEE